MKRKNDISRLENAVRKYYENPNKCLYCGKILEIKLDSGERPSDVKRKKFCSHSHAAIYNNHKYPKRQKDVDLYLCHRCGNEKSRGATYCQKCKSEITLQSVWKKSIDEYLLNGNSRTKYSAIRRWAKKYLSFLGIEKKCSLCGYDTAVDVCHIKPIGDFLPDGLMGEVNDLANLLYLCPNHHVELHMGLVNESKIDIIIKKQINKYKNKIPV